MAKTKIHVGLEIGTSKTCMVVGEVKPDATVTIIGVGEVPSEGVVRGEIEDTSKVISAFTMPGTWPRTMRTWTS